MNMLQVVDADIASVSRWAPQEYVGGGEIPLIEAGDVVPLVDGLDLWDCWPLAHEDGRTATIAGRQYWFFLSAPCFPDPAQRHDVARIRLISKGEDGWRDHGNAMPDGFSPGTREWAGCAVLHDDGVSVTLFFTAAGRRGEEPSLEQRLFATHGSLGSEGPTNWQTPQEIFAADGKVYMPARDKVARPGMIKAFRDPAWFRDPATGKTHIVFTASAGWSGDDYNGMVGLATLEGDQWVLGRPLIEAITVNNELERAHVIYRGGRYYLFWSTQRHTFGPGAAAGPNGIYGAVADHFDGPWTPVNTGGLIAANPESEATQSYSWWVTGEDEVWSFIDQWGMKGRKLADHPELLRAQFGGTPAPVFKLQFAGSRVTVAA